MCICTIVKFINYKVVVSIISFGSSYEDVADSILEYIDNNNLKAGYTLGDLQSLKDLFNVSFEDMTDALTELCNFGYINYITDTQNYCIAKKRTSLNISKIHSFTKYVTRQNHNTHSKILQFCITTCPKSISQTLNISFGSQIYLLKRLRFVDDLPIAIEFSYIPCALLPGLTNYDFSINSLFEILQSEYNVVPYERNVYYAISKPMQEDKELLNIVSDETAMWNVTGTTTIANGTVIEYTVTRMSALSAYYCSNPKIESDTPLWFQF